MKGTPAIYLGKIVSKKHFRAYVYASNGQKKLVESWEEFEASMQSGIWFANTDDADVNKRIPDGAETVGAGEKIKRKYKTKQKQKSNIEPVDESEDVLQDNDSVFEVTDDFLPKESE